MRDEVIQFRECSATFILALNDTMNVLNGKWKLPVIGTLLFGTRRFRELERAIPGITPRMLSKELKDLEANGIVERKVYDTIPVTVEYSLTSSGEQFRTVLESMIEWGITHRELFLAESAAVRPASARSEA